MDKPKRRMEKGGKMTLQEEIKMVLNKHCAENNSNTPDFILGEYLVACLEAFNRATNRRENWYGHEAKFVKEGLSILKEEK